MACGELFLIQMGNIGQQFLGSAFRPTGVLVLIASIPIALSSIALVPRIAKEEKMLLDAFGDDYTQYSRDVRWKLCPGVY